MAGISAALLPAVIPAWNPSNKLDDIDQLRHRP